jgi:hypothetical protein
MENMAANTTPPTTEQLINDDGVLDEKAAGEAIDKIMNEANAELQEVAEDEADAKAVTEILAKKDDSNLDDKSEVEGWTEAEDMQELMESLDYSQEDVAEFSGPEEFERHVRLMDREIKRRIQPGDEQENALEADDIFRTKNAKKQKATEQYREDGKFAIPEAKLPELDPDEFDERLIEALDARDAKIDELEARLNNSQQGNILSDFDSLVDDLGHEELFGDSEDLKPAEREERTRLFEEYKEIYNIMEARGKPVKGKAANRGIVLRALNLEFADEIKKKTRRDITTKVKKQQRRITGSNRRVSNKHYDGPIEKHPDLHQAFTDFEAENG